MVEPGVKRALERAATPAVVLADPDSASGLAEMLQQFVEQTLADSATKVTRARALRGALVIRSREDEGVAVRIEFLGDRIELADVGAAVPADLPSITGGFLAVSRVTTGRASPLGAVLRRDLTLHAGLGQMPFMLRVLGLLRVDASPRLRPMSMLVLPLLLLLAAALIWYFRR
jgi:hypothetical protein